MKILPTLCLASAFILAFTSCGEEDGSIAAVDNPQSEGVSVNVLEPLLIQEKPADVQTIKSVKDAMPQAGAEITIQGRIGGQRNPFIANRAVMLLADDTVIEACDFNADDHCAKPWDYCCVKKTDRLQNMVTVQAVDDNNKVLAAELRGLDEMHAGSFVIVKGVVSEKSSGTNLVLNITQIFHDRQRPIRIKAPAAK